MTRADGLDVGRRIRALGASDQPVMVAKTGWGRDEDRQRTREADFDHHLIKPVNAQTLEKTLTDNFSC